MSEYEQRLILDRGARDIINPGGKGIFEAIVEGTYPVNVVNKREGYEDRNPASDLVIPMSGTAPLQSWELEGYRTYPDYATVCSISDKLALFNWCRQEGIAAPLTWILPHNYILNKGSLERPPDGVRTLDCVLGGTVIKPRVACGEWRLVFDHIYTTDEWSLVRQHLDKAQSEVDLIQQRRIEGPTMKVYGCLPDQFYYQELGSNQEPQECPPTIKRLSAFILSEYGLRWGGLDYVIGEDGIWYFIDGNPTTRGKKIPLDKLQEFQARMREQVEAAVIGTEIEPLPKKMQIVITAAGVNKRLQAKLGALPKTLYRLPDGDTVLDKVMRMGSIFAQAEGFRPNIQVMHLPEAESYFNRWLQNRNDTATDLITPDPQFLTDGPQCAINHLFTTLPDSEYVLSLAADRVVDIPDEALIKAAEEAFMALDSERYPFALIAVPVADSSYRYFTDTEGRIIDFVNLKYETDAREGGIHVRKLAFAFNSSKMSFTKAKNTQNAINRLTKASCCGKLILLDGVTWYGDLDTPEDLVDFNQHFATI